MAAFSCGKKSKNILFRHDLSLILTESLFFQLFFYLNLKDNIDL